MAGYLTFAGNTGKKTVDSPDVKKTVTVKETMDIAVYYVKYTDKDSYLVREIHHVPLTEDGPVAVINELINTGPQTAGSVKILPSNTRLLGVQIKDGLATVDFSGEVLKANTGSSGEALGIQSIVNTLTEFPQVKEVSFKVDGKLDSRAKDWWGHVGLYDQPFKRNLEKVYEPAIWVTHPVEGQVAGVPLLVKGSSRVNEGKVSARLLDESGKKLAEESTDASKKAPDRGDFEMKITFTPPGKGKGTLEVFSGKPAGGSAPEVVQIPIQWP